MIFSNLDSQVQKYESWCISYFYLFSIRFCNVIIRDVPRTISYKSNLSWITSLSDLEFNKKKKKKIANYSNIIQNISIPENVKIDTPLLSSKETYSSDDDKCRDENFQILDFNEISTSTDSSRKNRRDSQFFFLPSAVVEQFFLPKNLRKIKKKKINLSNPTIIYTGTLSTFPALTSREVKLIFKDGHLPAGVSLTLLHEGRGKMERERREYLRVAKKKEKKEWRRVI